MNTVPSVGVLIIRDNKVLLVRHEERASHLTGTYGLPSGRLENYETHHQAAVRELREETGLVTTASDLTEYPNNRFEADIKRKDGTTQRFEWRVFVCKRYSGQLSPSQEVTPEWVDIDKIDQYLLLPNVKEAIMREMRK